MQTSDYLEQLVQDKDDLVDNLTTMGIANLTGDETFTELTPEVLNIPKISDYFKDTIAEGYYDSDFPAWLSSLKKLPAFKVGLSSFRDLGCLYTKFSGTDIDTSLINTVNTTRFYCMFDKCYSLLNLDISNFDFKKATNVNYMFRSCNNLTNLTFGTNLGKGYTATTTGLPNYTLDLSSSTLLTHDSLMSVINNLYDLNLTYDVANGGTLYRQSLVLGSTNLAKLSSAEIQIATDKGWDVS